MSELNKQMRASWNIPQIVHRMSYTIIIFFSDKQHVFGFINMFKHVTEHTGMALTFSLTPRAHLFVFMDTPDVLKYVIMLKNTGCLQRKQNVVITSIQLQSQFCSGQNIKNGKQT